MSNGLEVERTKMEDTQNRAYRTLNVMNVEWTDQQMANKISYRYVYECGCIQICMYMIMYVYEYLCLLICMYTNIYVVEYVCL
jgi:hypothetical protein